MGMIDANEKDNELNWAAFTYLKVSFLINIHDYIYC